MSLFSSPGQIVNTILVSESAELALPFRIDNSGMLATLSSETAQAVQHILTIAFTIPGERVMHPTYGAGIQRLVFENSLFPVFNEVASTLADQYQQTQTGFITVAVTVEKYFSTWVFNVAFTIGQDTTIHHAVFDYAGTLIGAT